MKVDLDQIRKDLKDSYGENEDEYKSCFYGVITWSDFKAMMEELEAARTLREITGSIYCHFENCQKVKISDMEACTCLVRPIYDAVNKYDQVTGTGGE